MFAETLSKKLAETGREGRVWNLETPFFGLVNAEGRHVCVKGIECPKIIFGPKEGEIQTPEQRLEWFLNEAILFIRKMEAKLLLENLEKEHPFFYLAVYENGDHCQVHYFLDEKGKWVERIIQTFEKI